MRLGNRSHRLLEPGIFLDAAWVEGISLHFDNMNCADFRAQLFNDDSHLSRTKGVGGPLLLKQ